MKNLRFHQYLHLILLFIIIFLYLTANKIAIQGVGNIQYLKNIVEITGVGWTALLLVITVKQGIDVNLPKNLLDAYRNFLGKINYVILLNGLLLFAVLALSFELSWYRDIQFLSNKKADLILNDEPGKVMIIAKLEKGELTAVRLKQGSRLLVACSGNELVAIDELIISPIWKKQEIKEVDIKFSEKSYEKTY